MDTDTAAKRSLRDKLKEIEERYDLDHDEDGTQYNLSESVIHAAIAAAVALKKSPIPGEYHNFIYYNSMKRGVGRGGIQIKAILLLLLLLY